MDKQEVLEQEQTFLAKTTKAFSLLEVSLIVFLVAVVFAFSIPVFTGASQSDLKNLTAKLINLVSYTRDQASTNNEPYFLYIGSNNNQIFSYQETSELNEFLDQDQQDQEAYSSKSITVKKVHPSLNISSIIYNNSVVPSISIRFDPSGFSEIFSVTFTDQETFITFEQTSVLGSFEVQTRK